MSVIFVEFSGIPPFGYLPARLLYTAIRTHSVLKRFFDGTAVLVHST
jgi:hypothetical protein